MKNICIVLSLLLISNSNYAQSVPVSSGLVAHFDNAQSNYSITNNLAVWTDNVSGIRATMSDPALMPAKINANGHTGLKFNALEYLATDINTLFSSTTPTMFVVKRGAVSPNMPTTLVALSTGNITEEFFLSDRASYFSSSSGNFIYKTHPCVDSIKEDNFVVSATGFTSTKEVFDYYLNDIKSAKQVQRFGTPWSHTVKSRKLGIGYRLDWSVDEKYQGEIYEILIYNRKLSDTEVNEVSNYLFCKYDISETFCGAQLLCENKEDPNSISNVNINQYFDVYPNPTSSQLSIHSKTNIKFDVALFDMIGKVYLNQTYNSSALLNIEHLPLGAYLIKVGSEEMGYFWKKIIKN